MINILFQNTLRCLQRGILTKINYAPVKKFVNTRRLLEYSAIKNLHYKKCECRSSGKELFYSVGLSISFFGLFKSEEEKKEPEVIISIKRSILLIQVNIIFLIYIFSFLFFLL